MRSLEPGQRRPMFEDENVQDAEFEGHAPTAQDEANFTKWLEKASGKQPSNDPRDAPENQGPGERGSEPDDAHAIRTWAAAEQKRMLDLKTSGELRAAMEVFLQDKRSRRLKTYQRPLYDALMQAIGKRGERLTADEEAAK